MKAEGNWFRRNDLLPPINLSNVQNRSAMKPMVILAGVAVLLAVTVSGWAYFSGAKAIQVQAQELNSALAPSPGNELAGTATSPKPDLLKPFVAQVEGWAKRLTLASAATGIGLTALMLAGASFWQRQARKPAVSDSAMIQQLKLDLQMQVKER